MIAGRKRPACGSSTCKHRGARLPLAPEFCLLALLPHHHMETNSGKQTARMVRGAASKDVRAQLLDCGWQLGTRFLRCESNSSS